MKKITAVTMTLLLCSMNAWSATGKVTKVKGKNAIVEFNQTVKPGEVVSTGDDLADGDNTGKGAIPGYGAKATRQYSFVHSFSLNSASSQGISTSGLGASGTFWFNFTNFELAPIVSLSNTSTGSINSSTTKIGGIGQYDFIPNKVGTILVPAIYGVLLLNSTSTAGTSASSTLIGIGGSLDWFPFIEHAAINVQVEYDSISGPYSTTTSQFLIMSGPKLYF